MYILKSNAVISSKSGFEGLTTTTTTKKTLKKLEVIVSLPLRVLHKFPSAAAVNQDYYFMILGEYRPVT